jgi:hypothetical protein
VNTTIAVNASSPIPPPVPVSSIQDIPLNRIQESKTNPRRTFDEAKLEELADFVPGNKTDVMWPGSFCGIRT